MNSKYLVIETTFPNLIEAQALVSELLNKRLIACGQISEIESHYSFEGKQFIEKEFKLVLKTRATLYQKCLDYITANHPYQVPQVICYEITCSPSYGKWIDEETKQAGEVL